MLLPEETDHRHFITAQPGFKHLDALRSNAAVSMSHFLVFLSCKDERDPSFEDKGSVPTWCAEANTGAACIGALREASSCQTTVDCEARGFWCRRWEMEKALKLPLLNELSCLQDSSTFNSFPIF